MPTGAQAGTSARPTAALPRRWGYLAHLGTISALTLPADNGTWSVTLVTSARDKALRALHDPAAWERAVRSLPLVAHWLDGQPIDDRVMAMAGIEDRHRNLMPGGVPVATGIVAAGDAWACSNPTVGRGASIGMLQATLLRDTITGTGLADPWEFACSFHHATADRPARQDHRPGRRMARRADPGPQPRRAAIHRGWGLKQRPRSTAGR